MGQKAASTTEKLRGGYYTPDVIAEFLSEWAVRRGSERVLEPSAGDGAIAQTVAARLKSRGHLVAVELARSEAATIAKKGLRRTEVVQGDAFRWFRAQDTRSAFDAVVGNPPFIRYQRFPERYRAPAFTLMFEAGLRPNRLTNVWVPFVVLATEALKPDGKLALVLPAELLQVTYAGELRDYLVRRFSQLTIVTFRKLIFPVQQEAILLLGVRGTGPASMTFLELDDAGDLDMTRLVSSRPVSVQLDHAREKWTQYYLTSRELALIRSLEESTAMTTIGDLADVDVGIVTGRNDFFVLRPSDAKRSGLEQWCLPLVGRSSQIPGLVLRREDWQELYRTDERCLLLQLGSLDRSQLPEQALAHVVGGEVAGFDEGYKCRIRKPRWWQVPATWTSDAFLLRQISRGPRIVVNEAGATCTDTIHRLRVRPGVTAAHLAAVSMNSLTFAFAEIRGRSYGGGVLELEPTEAESLPFPRSAAGLDVLDLDLWARRKELEEVLDEVDRRVLKDAGLTTRETKMLRGVWRKLSERRRSRRATAS